MNITSQFSPSTWRSCTVPGPYAPEALITCRCHLTVPSWSSYPHLSRLWDFLGDYSTVKGGEENRRGQKRVLIKWASNLDGAAALGIKRHRVPLLHISITLTPSSFRESAFWAILHKPREHVPLHWAPKIVMAENWDTRYSCWGELLIFCKRFMHKKTKRRNNFLFDYSTIFAKEKAPPKPLKSPLLGLKCWKFLLWCSFPLPCTWTGQERNLKGTLKVTWYHQVSSPLLCLEYFIWVTLLFLRKDTWTWGSRHLPSHVVIFFFGLGRLCFELLELLELSLPLFVPLWMKPTFLLRNATLNGYVHLSLSGRILGMIVQFSVSMGFLLCRNLVGPERAAPGSDFMMLFLMDSSNNINKMLILL